MTLGYFEAMGIKMVRGRSLMSVTTRVLLAWWLLTSAWLSISGRTAILLDAACICRVIPKIYCRLTSIPFGWTVGWRNTLRYEHLTIPARSAERTILLPRTLIVLPVLKTAGNPDSVVGGLRAEMFRLDPDPAVFECTRHVRANRSSPLSSTPNFHVAGQRVRWSRLVSSHARDLWSAGVLSGATQP